ncbi:MAG: MDR family MFS transporter [Vicinamibacterales bacterium]
MPPGRVRRRVATLGVLGGSFLAAVEATIVATAMPTVVAQLGGLAHYSWVFSAYVLTSTVTMPLWGKLSDLYGRRPFYLASIAIFVLGSALSGMAHTMTELIVCRALQGFGAGGLVPLGMTIIGELYTLEERARMQGVFSGVWGVASIVGPLVGGFITERISWRWVFYLNLPLGILAATLVMAGLPAMARRAAPRIDYLGAGLFVASLTAMMIALGQTGAPDASLAPTAVAGLYAVAAVLGALFLRVEQRAAEPILPLTILRGRFVAPVTICGFLLGGAMFSALSFVPLFIQGAMGGTATQAGSVMTPLLLGWVSMAIVTGRLLPKVGYRPMIIGGLCCITLGFVGLLGVTRESALRWIYAYLGLMGLGMGMAALALMLALQNAVDRAHLGVATSLGAFTRSVGGAIGVAILGSVVAVSMPSGAPPSPAAIEIALHRAFILATGMCAGALLVSMRVPSGLPTPSRVTHADGESSMSVPNAG